MVTAISGAADGLRPSQAAGEKLAQGANAPIVISSLLVKTASGEMERIIAELEQIDGVETHGSHGDSVIVTIEAASINASYAIATSITAVNGVANVHLVYANFEDDPLIQKQLQG